MKIWKIIVSITVITTVFSCSDTQPAKEHEKEQCVAVDSLSRNGFEVKYCKEFSRRGACIREGLYVNSMPFDFHKFYDSSGVKEYEREYVITGPKEYYLNRVIKFERNGDTLFEGSNFYEIKTYKNKILLGDTFVSTITLRAAYFKSDTMAVLIDNPDDSSKVYNLFSTNNSVQFEYVPREKKKYFLEGTIREAQRNSSQEKARDLLFTLEFEVDERRNN